MDQDTQKNIGAITMAALLVMSIVLLTLFRYWSAIVGPLIVVIVGLFGPSASWLGRV